MLASSVGLSVNLSDFKRGRRGPRGGDGRSNSLKPTGYAAPMPSTFPPIDARIARFNQAVLAFFLAMAFVFDLRWMVPIMAIILLVGVLAGPEFGLFQRIFRDVISKQLPPADEFEDPNPPRFAALVAAIVLTASSVCLLGGAPGVGWILTIIVVFLAAFAAITKFCMACEAYDRFFASRGR